MKRITLKTKKIKILTLLLILPLAVYFWPSQLYGDTSYIMLMGNSMKGTIDSGTFVVIKPEQEYMSGDIIAFVNEDGKNVIHRIVDKTEKGFITKGDNNRRDDPGIVNTENIIGRSIFVAPFVGFTSMFLQTPLGMSIFGVWALIMFTRNRPKKNKKHTQESFMIFKIGIISVLTNYILTQSAIGINPHISKTMAIPLSNFLEVTTANTVSFSMLMIAIFVLYYFVRIQDKKTKDVKVGKMILSLGVIMITVFQIISMFNIIPFWIGEINKLGIMPNLG